MDETVINVITDNVCDSPDASHDAAGLGAAFLRVVSANDIHGNLRDGQPSDFGWFHELTEGYPGWVSDRDIRGNWWGTTDEALIAATVFDGSDDPEFGTVTVAPVAQAPVAAPTTRAVITTRKLRYLDAGEAMPVFLTVYNPGARRTVQILILVEYGQAAPAFYGGPLDFPGAVRAGAGWRITLPDNSVYFTELVKPEVAESADRQGRLRAVLFDADSGAPLDDGSAARFELRAGGQP